MCSKCYTEGHAHRLLCQLGNLFDLQYNQSNSSVNTWWWVYHFGCPLLKCLRPLTWFTHEHSKKLDFFFPLIWPELLHKAVPEKTWNWVFPSLSKFCIECQSWNITVETLDQSSSSSWREGEVQRGWVTYRMTSIQKSMATNYNLTHSRFLVTLAYHSVIHFSIFWLKYKTHSSMNYHKVNTQPL